MLRALITAALIFLAASAQAGSNNPGGGGGSTAASALTGTTLAPNVVNSSLTSPKATNSSLGLVECDGSTTSCATGIITAIGGSATSIVPGTTTIGGASSPCSIVNTTSTVMGCVAYGTTGTSTIVETNGSGALASGIIPFGSATNQVAEGGVITAGGPTGSATVTPIITYNAAGQLTTVSSATIAPAIGSVTGLGTGVATALGDAVNTNGGVLTASTAAIASNAIVTGAGSGTALTGTTPGTGVLTALGNAVNTSGGLATSAVASLASLTTVGTIGTGTWNSGFGASATECSSSSFGLCKVDNTTITASGGVITAVGGAATSITPGTTTIGGATAPCAIVNSATTVMACDALGTGVVTALGDAVNTNGGVLTASTAAIASNAIVTGAGSGTALTGTTPGTGVLTALGDNANATGGFGTVGTSGSNVCLLNASCTHSGTDNFTGSFEFSGTLFGLGVANIFTAAQSVTPTTISTGTCTGTYTLTPSGTASNDYVVNCAASAALTIANPSTLTPGTTLNFMIVESGAITLSAVGTDYLFPGGSLPTLTGTATDMLSCRVETTAKIICAAPMLALANP